MAKKNNKTAHVLRLITTSEAPQLQELEDETQSRPTHVAGLSFLPSSQNEAAQFRIAEQAPSVMEEPPVPISSMNMGVTSYVNLNELAVSVLAGKIMKRMNNCTCKKCTDFVITYSASLLTEKFVSFTEGEVLKREYATENSKELTALILKACFKLKTNPLH